MIKDKIKNWIKETFKTEQDFVLLHPKDIKNGDYSFFAGPKLANDFGRALQANQIPEIEKIEIVGGFINFYLSKKFFDESVKEILEEGERYGKNERLNDQKIIIEHTQPNPFKEFHIGHLMNNAIGESVSRILKSNKAEVKTASYHGDVGLHVAKAIYSLNLTLSEISPFREMKEKIDVGISIQGEFINGPGDKELLKKAYAHGHKLFEESEAVKKDTIDLNKKIYNKNDPWINFLYKKFKTVSLDYFSDIYKRLGSNFDGHFYESESGELGKEIVKENIGKVFEESDGAVIFRGENFEPKTHTRVFINKEDLPTYEAKEVGLAKIKREKWPDYTKSITVTANEQDSFFDVVEVAIGEVFPELKGKLKHISHGMLKLPQGKMSSRTGNIITADSLINQVKEKVLEKIKDRDFNDDQKNEIAEIVAIGAIKYSILRQAIGGDIIFDFDKSISFEGDSGPYLQYTAVRANSVLKKSKAAKIISSADVPDFSSKNTASEIVLAAPITQLERYLYRFQEVVERAGEEYAPHHIVTYLTELASTFNSFYAKEKIIDPSLSGQAGELDSSSVYKLALTQSVYHILKNGLYLLGIKVPERM